ncbi:nitrate reductase [Mesorhizobium xinjiangense]|uniref:nitrate reductase n=1 Tax=Mesorhizobium xinjiangense TaxID=2678685 RepID=UPI0012ED6C8D|nr:nitrate reductase [Mesorhizobium xinjiangense]
MADQMKRGRWSLWRAFLLGAVLGALVGVAWGSLDYGAFDVAYLSNHVLGVALMGGALFVALAAFLNWRRRNPL